MFRRRENQIPLSAVISFLRDSAHIPVTVIGNHERFVTGLSSTEDFDKDSLSFLTQQHLHRSAKIISSATSGALFVPQSFDTTLTAQHLTLLVVDDPFRALIAVVALFFERVKPSPSISPHAAVASSAMIGENVHVGHFSVIGEDVLIEKDAVIHPHVVLYEGAVIRQGAILHAGAIVREFCEVGSHTIIQSNAVVGSDGFGYLPDPLVGLLPIPQVGTVLLQSRVEVGANTCIDRATLGTTFIGNGTKIDNLVQIGHNTQVGSHSIICGNVGIAGSCKIGNQVVLGGGSGIADHVTIHDGIRTAGLSGVTGDLKDKGDYAGFPAVPVKEWRRNVVALRRLPETLKQLLRSSQKPE